MCLFLILTIFLFVLHVSELAIDLVVFPDKQAFLAYDFWYICHLCH